MVTKPLGWTIWFVCLVLLWSVQPLFLTQARSVIIFGLLTALLALLGGLFGLAALLVWSAAVGLCNLTLALLLTAYPPALWVGLSAGLLLLAFLDSGQRLMYIRHCWLAPGVTKELLRPGVILSGITLLVGLGLGGIVVSWSTSTLRLASPGIFTISGACILVGFLAIFLLYTNRLSEGE